MLQQTLIFFSHNYRKLIALELCYFSVILLIKSNHLTFKKYLLTYKILILYLGVLCKRCTINY